MVEIKRLVELFNLQLHAYTNYTAFQREKAKWERYARYTKWGIGCVNALLLLPAVSYGHNYILIVCSAVCVANFYAYKYIIKPELDKTIWMANASSALWKQRLKDIVSVGQQAANLEINEPMVSMKIEEFNNEIGIDCAEELDSQWDFVDVEE